MTTTTEELRILFRSLYDEKGAKKAAEGLDETGDAAKRLETRTESVKKAFQITSRVAAAFGVAMVAAKKTFDFASEGEELDKVRKKFESLNATVGDLSDDTLAGMREASKNTITDFKLMELGGQLLNLQVAKTGDEVVSLVDKVLRLKQPSVSAQEALENFSAMLSNKSIPRLDSFGINAGVVTERMSELQSGVDGLTSDMAFMQAVNEQMDVTLARSGATAETTASVYKELSTEIGNATDRGKVWLDQTLSPAVRKALDFNIAVDGVISSMREMRSELAGSTETYEEYTEALKDAGLWILPNSRDTFEHVQALNAEAVALENSAQMTRQIIDARDDLRDITTAILIMKWMEAEQEYTGTIEEQTTVAFKRNEAIARYRPVIEANTRARAEAIAVEKQATASEVFAQLEETTNARIRARDSAEAYHQAVRAETSSLFLNADANRELGSTFLQVAAAEGITATETALIAQEFGLLNDAQIRAQISAGALEAKERQLGEALAAGDISLAEAITSLQDFQTELSNGDDDLLAFAGGVDALTGSARAAETGVRDTILALDDLDGRTVTATVNVNQNNNTSRTVAGGQQVEVRAHGGTMHAGQTALVGERGPELITTTNNARVVNTTTTNNILNLATSQTSASVQQNFRRMQAQAGSI
jgi:hypothetical protein